MDRQLMDRSAVKPTGERIATADCENGWAEAAGDAIPGETVLDEYLRNLWTQEGEVDSAPLPELIQDASSDTGDETNADLPEETRVLQDYMRQAAAQAAREEDSELLNGLAERMRGGMLAPIREKLSAWWQARRESRLAEDRKQAVPQPIALPPEEPGPVFVRSDAVPMPVVESPISPLDAPLFRSGRQVQRWAVALCGVMRTSSVSLKRVVGNWLVDRRQVLRAAYAAQGENVRADQGRQTSDSSVSAPQSPLQEMWGKLKTGVEAVLFFLILHCYRTGLLVRKAGTACLKSGSAVLRTCSNFVHYRRWKRMSRARRSGGAVRGQDSEDLVRMELMPAPSFDVVAAFERMEKAVAARCISLVTGIPRKLVTVDGDRSTQNRYLRAFANRCTTLFIPVASVFLLCAILYSVKDYRLGVRVYLEGDEVALLANEADYDAIASRVEQYVSDITGTTYQLRAVPTYQVALVDRANIGSTEGLEEVLLRSASNAVVESNGLYIDGELVAVNDDENELMDILANIRMAYAGGDEGATVEFAQDVRIEPGLYARNKVRSAFEVEQLLTSTKQEEVVYVIQSDDIMGTIAPRFDMTVAQLKALNPTVDERKLREGMELTVSRAVPFLTVKAVKTVQYNEALPYTREVLTDETMYTYESKVKQRGVEGVAAVTAEICEIDGLEVSRLELTRSVVSDPVTQVEIKGTKKPPSNAPTGSFRAPVSGGVVTSRYGSRGGGYHTGLDIGLPIGTSIVAADGGVVTFSGWSGGYGYMIKLSHSNGTETWYAHCSALLVSKGQAVAKGQPIARVGNTGRSTGPHLHFEVRINGTHVNPAPYIGK